MRNIKNFRTFNESYSDDLSEVLENENNQYVAMKGDDILIGYDTLSNCLIYISELLEMDGAISEEQKFEFDDYVMDSDIDKLVNQIYIDDFVSDILDRFEVVEPYRVYRRDELEETPIDISTDITTDEYGNELGDDIEIDININDYNRMLGESLDNESHCIIGKINGKEEIIDRFKSEEEANEFLPDYELVYNEFTDLRVELRELNECNTNKECWCRVETDHMDCECGCDGDCGEEKNNTDCGCDEPKSSETIMRFGDYISSKK